MKQNNLLNFIPFLKYILHREKNLNVYRGIGIVSDFFLEFLLYVFVIQF